MHLTQLGGGLGGSEPDRSKSVTQAPKHHRTMLGSDAKLDAGIHRSGNDGFLGSSTESSREAAMNQVVHLEGPPSPLDGLPVQVMFHLSSVEIGSRLDSSA